MPESLAGPLTLFDAAALAVVLISALMAVARGFMRELATLGAFVAAVAGTYSFTARFTNRSLNLCPQTCLNGLPPRSSSSSCFYPFTCLQLGPVNTSQKA